MWQSVLPQRSIPRGFGGLHRYGQFAAKLYSAASTTKCDRAIEKDLRRALLSSEAKGKCSEFPPALRMASNDRVNLSAYLGANVPDHIREQLAEAVTRAIQHPDADVDAILQRAITIANRAIAGEIQNVLHYATKAFFELSKKKRRQAAAEPLVFSAAEYFDNLRNGSGGGSEIEAQILLEDLLDNLSPTERDVYKRRLEGWSHEEISQQLGISTDNSRTCLSRAKRHVMNWLKPKR